MNPQNKNPFENSWDEITKTFQNQFSKWLKVSETYFDYMNDNQKKMFQSLHEQCCSSLNDTPQQTSHAKKETVNKHEDELDEDIFEDNWKDHMVDAQKKWNKLTNDNLAEINGNREKLVSLLQKNYSIANKEAEKQIKDWEKTRSKI